MRLLTFSQAYFARSPARFALVSSLALRLVWALLALPGMYFQVHMERFWHVGPSGLGYFYTPTQLVDIWARWDAIYYLQIAEWGYACGPDYLCTAFFPLYSLLVRGLQQLTHLSYLASGLVLANAFDLAGFALIALWFARRLAVPHAFWAFLAFAAFPTRNFGFSLYTEGLFLTLSVGAFLAYETRRYKLCSLLSALCSASRPQGVLVGFALWTDGVWARWRRDKAAPPMRGIAVLCAAPLGLGAYMLYLYRAFGDPWMFVRVQHVWHRHVQAPWRIIGVHAEPIEYVVLIAAVALCVWGIWQGAKVRETLYVGACLLVPMCTGRFTSINRFVGVLFPLFALGAVAPKKRGVSAAYWLLCAVYTAVFAFKLGQGAKVI
jgi:hypothetical protein